MHRRKKIIKIYSFMESFTIYNKIRTLWTFLLLSIQFYVKYVANHYRKKMSGVCDSIFVLTTYIKHIWFHTNSLMRKNCDFPWRNLVFMLKPYQGTLFSLKKIQKIRIKQDKLKKKIWKTISNGTKQIFVKFPQHFTSY